TFIAVARRSGAEVRDKTPVTSIEEGEGLVAVVVGNEKVYAEAIVVTAGAWVRGLVEPLGIDVPVRPTRETIAYFKVDGDIGPTFVEWSDPSVYALPSPRHDALKVGEHIAGPDADPDVDGEPDQSSIDRLAAWVAERYPSVERGPILAETCFYTNTDDQRFILERHGRVIVGSPCSGHGFKFAPLIGQQLAGLAQEVL
ncbi:MAG TPA: FAD-dependent oxidoreductase, partial [Actinomycetota bacterium]|nr:FAD-dependent oxidoreductase [Actinomycetota bacterium]